MEKFRNALGAGMPLALVARMAMFPLQKPHVFHPLTFLQNPVLFFYDLFCGDSYTFPSFFSRSF